MAAGRPPFVGTREEILAARRAGLAPSIGRDGLPDGLRYLVFCLLAPEPARRPGSAAEVAGHLEHLRATNAQIERLLASALDREVLKTVAAFLKEESGVQFRSAFVPNIDLPPDHRLLMQAIMALAETHYRRAAIDAGTASEVALASAIFDELQEKGLNREYIEHNIRIANGLDGLYSLYLSLGHTLPVSPGNVRANLAGVRNSAAHAGRIPSAEEANRAIEIGSPNLTGAPPAPPPSLPAQPEPALRLPTAPWPSPASRLPSVTVRGQPPSSPADAPVARALCCPAERAVFPVQFPFSAAGTLNASPNIHRRVFDRVSRSLAFRQENYAGPSTYPRICL